MSKKRISKAKKIKELEKLKKNKPLIVFKANKLVVTLKNKEQLKRWLIRHPEGSYTINPT